MTTAHVTENVNASVDAVWKILSDFSGLKKLLPVMVASCLSEGQGLGATRSITTLNGDTVSETVSKFDETNKSMSYTIDSGTLPVKNYEATFVVSDIDGNTCRIDWSSEFEVNGLSEEETIELFTGLYTVCIASLRTMLGLNSAAAE